MKAAIIFDIDNTLTPPRRPIAKKMVDILNRLCVPFSVAAGSHLSILQDQFFKPLYELGFRKQFDAFISNGAIHCRCDYSGEMSIVTVSEFNIKTFLGDDIFSHVEGVLMKTLMMEAFALPVNLEVFPQQIAFRVSMINLCPIGRPQQDSEAYHVSRDGFVSFDKTTGYRQKVIGHLKKEFSELAKSHRLTVTLGGQTSFDIGIVGQDKTLAVKALLNEGFEEATFFGDALFEGGNDAALREFVENWPSGKQCPLETVQVNCWQDTLAQLSSRGFIDGV
ncbi:MAG TPA: hypothetical protein VFC63_05110 [Blastocatellia bacterium]|nr:hypothetical protein [Blastocatellia bacterium]